MERFYLDHGMWHDRETGQHMYTEDEYYGKYQDGLAANRDMLLAKERECQDLYAEIARLQRILANDVRGGW